MKQAGEARWAPSSLGLWQAVGRQLAHPKGLGGWAAAMLMGFANRRPIRLAVDALEVGPDDFVLDLGCGGGEALRLIANRATRGVVQGIDASPLMLARAARANRAEIAGRRVRLVEARFDALPFPDGAFDKVLAVNVMYFWHDPGPILAEIRRVLRPGGRLIVYVTDAADMRRWKFAGPESHRLFDSRSLSRALEGGGFDSVRVAREPLPGGVTGLLGCAESPLRSVAR